MTQVRGNQIRHKGRHEGNYLTGTNTRNVENAGKEQWLRFGV